MIHHNSKTHPEKPYRHVPSPSLSDLCEELISKKKHILRRNESTKETLDNQTTGLDISPEKSKKITKLETTKQVCQQELQDKKEEETEKIGQNRLIIKKAPVVKYMVYEDASLSSGSSDEGLSLSDPSIIEGSYETNDIKSIKCVSVRRGHLELSPVSKPRRDSLSSSASQKEMNRAEINPNFESFMLFRGSLLVNSAEKGKHSRWERINGLARFLNTVNSFKLKSVLATNSRLKGLDLHTTVNNGRTQGREFKRYNDLENEFFEM